MKMKNIIKATDNSIGKLAVLADNSYTKDINTGENVHLEQRAFTILSKPYIEVFRPEGARKKLIKREFVNVYTRGNIYRVLNNFFIIVKWQR